jgi:hypothetical protein
MLKIDVRFVVGGKAYKVKKEVKTAVKKGILATAVFGFAAFGVVSHFEATNITESEVVYEEVFIGDSIGTAAEAIKSVNGNVDYRDLLHLFEDANDVARASEIQAGTYLVPVIAE